MFFASLPTPTCIVQRLGLSVPSSGFLIAFVGGVEGPLGSLRLAEQSSEELWGSGCVYHDFRIYLCFSTVWSVRLLGAEGALNAFLLPSMLVPVMEHLQPTVPCEQIRGRLPLAMGA